MPADLHVPSSRKNRSTSHVRQGFLRFFVQQRALRRIDGLLGANLTLAMVASADADLLRKCGSTGSRVPRYSSAHQTHRQGFSADYGYRGAQSDGDARLGDFEEND